MPSSDVVCSHRFNFDFREAFLGFCILVDGGGLLLFVVVFYGGDLCLAVNFYLMMMKMSHRFCKLQISN